VEKVFARRDSKMPPTMIIECSQCSGLLLATKDQKTRSCPYCGAKVNLQKAQRVATAENAFEASAILRKLKEERKRNAPKLNSQ
jgi:DNA-directed RNA polymerase subunit RPC12/RpoP